MQVLLIHGLARTSLSLLSLDWSLQQAGYRPEHFSYFAFAERFDQIVDRLQQHCHKLAQQGEYAVVAYSLGGVLIRAALDRAAQPSHIVMLATPNQPPRLAAYAWQFLPFRWLSGQCGFNLASPAFYQTLPGLRSPYTIIAGTMGERGLFSPFGNDLNDGIVALNETRISPDDQVIALPVEHTFLMHEPVVHQAVLQALPQPRSTLSPSYSWVS